MDGPSHMAGGRTTSSPLRAKDRPRGHSTCTTTTTTPPTAQHVVQEEDNFGGRHGLCYATITLECTIKS